MELPRIQMTRENQMIRHYSRVLLEAAQFRALRDIYQSDPQQGPTSAALFLHHLAFAPRQCSGQQNQVQRGRFSAISLIS
jgi:hypothetical protein